MTDGEIIAEALSWMPEEEWRAFVRRLATLSPSGHRLRLLAQALQRCGNPEMARDVRACLMTGDRIFSDEEIRARLEAGDPALEADMRRAAFERGAEPPFDPETDVISTGESDHAYDQQCAEEQRHEDG